MRLLLTLLVSLLGASVFAAPPPEKWSCGKLGHIFLTGQPVELQFAAGAGPVEWVVTDFWQREVEKGSAPAEDGGAAIKPKTKAVGYYLLHATAAGQDGYTSFAIVRPHAAADSLHSPFGVMTHFAQGMNPEMLPLFKQIGIESIRDEHYWGQVEKTKGVYEFSPRSDAYMKACQEAGIAPLIPMTFGNKLYDGDKGPTTPAGYEGYAKYGQAILQHYGPQIHWLEIWNEYNGTWAPEAAKKDRPRFYTDMLKAAYEGIKKERPDVQVLGGAAVLIPLPYFERLFQNGALSYMDAVVIHPYRATPEGVDREVAALQALIRKYNHGQDKPIWATETGRQSKEEYDWEMGRKMYEKGRAEGARYLARQYTLLLQQKVARAYWYVASDHDNFVTMGLLRHDAQEASGMGRYAVAPAYVSYANLIHQLDGAQFVRREAVREYTRAYVELFQRGSDEVRVCWATQPTKLRVKAGGSLLVADLMGAEKNVPLAQGEATLDLSEDAIYLRGPVKAVSEVESGFRILASSLDDYSKTQGENGWTYGYQEGDGPFQELQQVETMWGYKWGGRFPNLSIWGAGMHPDKAGGKEILPVRRWVSPVSGKVTVRCRCANPGKGDGTMAVLCLDGAEVWSQAVGGAAPKTATGEVSLELKNGSLLDCLVKPNANVLFDSTMMEVTIVQMLKTAP